MVSLGCQRQKKIEITQILSQKLQRLKPRFFHGVSPRGENYDCVGIGNRDIVGIGNRDIVGFGNHVIVGIRNRDIFGIGKCYVVGIGYCDIVGIGNRDIILIRFAEEGGKNMLMSALKLMIENIIHSISSHRCVL